VTDSTIGITGGNGFIGNHLLRSAIARGHRPIVFLERGTSTAPIADLAGQFEAVEGNLLEPASVDGFLARCRNVFHLAGFNRYWARDAATFERVNHEAVRILAEKCLRHRIDKLVHVSSCITLGASETPEPRDESSGFNLTDIPFPYARTKKAGEEVVRDLARNSGLPAVIVNPASAIGERDHGPTPIGKPIADISQGKWPVYVAGGACFIDVHDVVRGLWLAMEKGRVGEQYLLAGENLTNREFMSRVAACAGVAQPKVRVPLPVLRAVASVAEWLADRVTQKEPVLTRGMTALIGKYLYFDGRKARDELGFEAGPCTGAIERSVAWFRAQRAS
jgi:dihydroflavonol-4-reductase